MHFFGLNGGYVDHEQDADGAWWIGIRCGTCGEFERMNLSRYQDCDHRSVTVTEDGGRCNDCGRDLHYDTTTRNWQ